MTIKTLKYVSASRFNLPEEVWESIRNADVTWGDTAHSLVTREKFCDLLSDAIAGEEIGSDTRKHCIVVIADLNKLAKTTFVDLAT